MLRCVARWQFVNSKIADPAYRVAIASTGWGIFDVRRSEFARWAL